MTRGTRAHNQTWNSVGGGTCAKKPPKSSQVRKIAVESHWGPFMTDSTSRTVQFSPTQELAGGCSLLPEPITSQLTFGKLPAMASVTNWVGGTTCRFHRAVGRMCPT